jgi:hypothetical protein
MVRIRARKIIDMEDTMQIAGSTGYARRAPLGLAVVLIMLLLSTPVWGGLGCGDVDGNGEGPDIGDITCLIAYQFLGGPQPPVWATCDIDNDGKSDISDLTQLIDYLYVSLSPLQCLGKIKSNTNSGCLLHGGAERTPVASTSSSDCLSVPATASFGELMEAKFIGSSLHVYHKYAYYNCCKKYAVTWQVVGENITAYEADTAAAPCECLCYFNLEATLNGVPPTSTQRFIVKLVGINGNTVGVDTLWMGPKGYFYAETFGHDIYLHHENATINCCGKFAMDYTVSGNNIFAQELDTSSYQCKCECPLDLMSVLYGVAPGTYEVFLLGPPHMPDPMHDTIGIDTVTVDTTGGLGGPCYYNAIEGVARIYDIFNAPANGYNCVNAKEVRFEFIPKDSTAPSRYLYPNVKDKYPKLTVGAGMNPSQAFLDAKGIYRGPTLPCERREITWGTCTAVVFVFPTIDFSDWASYCF